MYEYNISLFKNDSESKFYIIGLIAADGYISKKNNRIEIALKESDYGYLSMIKDLICPSKKLYYKQKQRAYRLTIDNKEIKREVMKYINTTDKTTNLLFPYGIPQEHIKHFMRGYSDGDGSIGVVRGQKKLMNSTKYYYGLRYRVLGTRQFLQGWVQNSKVYANTPDRNVHRKGTENVYYVEYGFKTAVTLCDYMYDQANIKLNRKYEVFKYISETDSDKLRADALNGESHYNTRGIPNNRNKDIVDALGN